MGAREGHERTEWPETGAADGSSGLSLWGAETGAADGCLCAAETGTADGSSGLSLWGPETGARRHVNPGSTCEQT